MDDLYADLVVREDLAAIQQAGVTDPDDCHQYVTNPSELFTKNGKPVKDVFMLGQPGYGKTTFCLYLLKLWCSAKTTLEKSGLSLWQFGMIVFDFVFYVALRHIDSCRSSIIDMICEDVFERDDGNKEVIRHVLGSPRYRCLIVVDGLDEWVFSPEVQTKLQKKGLPNTRGLSISCTVLYASRHWKVDLIQPKYSKNDIVVEILGLTDKGVDTIIQNIFVKFFKMDLHSPEYQTKFKELKRQLQNSKLKSSMKIPMLVTLSVFLGFDGHLNQESMTGFAFDQLDLLIRRAVKNEHIENDIKMLDLSITYHIDTPKIIQQNKHLLGFLVVLYKLGKIAFHDLISKTSHLVFNLDTLQEALGERELELALKVGIVGQTRAPGRFHVPKVSIEFFHKSIQEALAALYIVCDKSEAFSSLCKYCCTVDKIMEMSNVLQFVAGINPDTSCKCSKHFVNITSNDQEIVNEREKMSLITSGRHGRARMLYDLHCICHEEFGHTLSFTQKSDKSPQYHMVDVILREWDGDDNIRTTCDMIRGCPESMLSFAMWISDTTPWSAKPVLQILPTCSHLTTLQVWYSSTAPDPELVSVIPALTHLQRVEYYHTRGPGEGRGDVDNRVVLAILQLPRLRHVKLEWVELEDDTLVVKDMTNLQKVELYRVDMSPEAWNRFVTSLVSLKHFVQIALHYGCIRRALDINSRIVCAICQIPQLVHVEISFVELDDGTLVVSEHMTQLQKVELYDVLMPVLGWNRFVASLGSVKHDVEVRIMWCDIDEGTRDMICKSKYVIVSEKNNFTIEFVSKPKV